MSESILDFTLIEPDFLADTVKDFGLPASARINRGLTALQEATKAPILVVSFGNTARPYSVVIINTAKAIADKDPYTDAIPWPPGIRPKIFPVEQLTPITVGEAAMNGSKNRSIPLHPPRLGAIMRVEEGIAVMGLQLGRNAIATHHIPIKK